MRTLKLSLTALLLAVPLLVTAGGQHSGGPDNANADDMDMGSMNMTDMDISSMKKIPVDAADMPNQGGHGGHGGHAMGGHAHDSWAKPPAAYSTKTFDRWESYDLAVKGMELYRDNCMSCHGIDGRGTGPLAKSLAHPPADLTNHFHNAAGDGDQYLFWRVTKGGTVEPFKSADSMMPAFESSLSEEERWSVLSYIHQVFHRGFKDAANGMAGGHGNGHH